MRIFLLFVIALPACSGSVEEFAPSQITSGMRFLNESSGDGYAQVVESRAFQFPADHRSHDEYQSEWWYFTGNLETKGSRHFGFELTFFRYALTAQQSTHESRRRSNSPSSLLQVRNGQRTSLPQRVVQLPSKRLRLRTTPPARRSPRCGATPVGHR